MTHHSHDPHSPKPCHIDYYSECSE